MTKRFQRLGVGRVLPIGHATEGCVRVCTAKIIKRDLFSGDGLDDVRAGDEHVAGLIHHENKIGHGG